MRLNLKGREVDDVDVCHGRSRDIVDSYIQSAVWADTGLALTDDELVQLQEENEGEVQQYALENGGWH